jgi:hypothetical protein
VQESWVAKAHQVILGPWHHATGVTLVSMKQTASLMMLACDSLLQVPHKDVRVWDKLQERGESLVRHGRTCCVRAHRKAQQRTITDAQLQ